ncbi:hypothetical protein HDF17_002178 [Granulicella arctica]|uniref:Uncharacterized protein n=1 Tax=Granulicella arctica TaxID=940613 RepID=A0A7Y9TTD0_9BACT|nr:hypothetical protein [Granulicella arctica]
MLAEERAADAVGLSGQLSAILADTALEIVPPVVKAEDV